MLLEFWSNQTLAIARLTPYRRCLSAAVGLCRDRRSQSPRLRNSTSGSQRTDVDRLSPALSLTNARARTHSPNLLTSAERRCNFVVQFHLPIDMHRQFLPRRARLLSLYKLNESLSSRLFPLLQATTSLPSQTSDSLSAFSVLLPCISDTTQCIHSSPLFALLDNILRPRSHLADQSNE